ncbi:PAS domain S-box protein, partial [bacterium]|nr:PAS domain S-box protein [bacterium]
MHISGRVLGKHYLDLVHPDERSRGDNDMSLLMNGELDHVNLERRYIRAGGEDFWGHLSGQRLSSPDGRFLGLVGIIADISELKKMQALMVQTEKMMS